MTIRTPGSPETVTSDVEMRILLESGVTAPMPCALTYNVGDPYAVQATFRHSEGEVTWVFARDLLRSGVLESAGEGDIKVRPVTVGGETLIQLELSSPSGRAVIQADRSEIAEFVEASDDLLPPGMEWQYLNFDNALADLLGDSGF